MTLGIGFAFAALANAGGIKADDNAKGKLKLTPYLEDRERFERRTNKGFSSKIADNVSDLYTRTRAGVKFSYENITGQVVYQYSHDLDWYHKENSSTDNSELLLGYANIPN